MEVKVEWSELRLWNGGICPVGPDDLVWVLLENMSHCRAAAYVYNWSHRGGPWDIIAYRVEVKPTPLIEMWANVFTDSDVKERVTGLIFGTEAAARIAAFPGDRQVLLREVRE